MILAECIFSQSATAEVSSAYFDKDHFIKSKVYPKEGTRVRIPGMYHITTWYGAESDTRL